MKIKKEYKETDFNGRKSVKNIIKIVKKSEKFKNKIKCCIGYFLLSRTLCTDHLCCDEL